MSRKPTSFPDRNFAEAGSGRSSWRLATLRPLGPVPSDREADWVPLKDALQMLSPVVPNARDAGAWMLRHIASGEVPITCRLLTYRKHGAAMASCERHEWPGRDARLPEQIERAVSHPLSGFHALPGTVDLEWLDVTGDYSVDVRMSFPHVDRAALLSFFPDLKGEQLAAQTSVSPPDLPATTIYRGRLPANAAPSDLRDEPFAHEAACKVRAGMGLAEALREVALEDPMRTPASVHSGIRRTYTRMYDKRGVPIQN